MEEKKEKAAHELTREELRKRLVLDATAGPGGIDTSLSRIGPPLGPLGEHLTEEKKPKNR